MKFIVGVWSNWVYDDMRLIYGVILGSHLAVWFFIHGSEYEPPHPAGN